ncbi:hypothetical protein JCM10449v2_005289 [Rhodotorula kratochvilovae]
MVSKHPDRSAARLRELTDRNKRDAPLVRLPPDLFQKILVQDTGSVITHTNFVLCKSLLPATKRALYTDCQLFSVKRLAQFAAALLHNPSLLHHVEDFGLTYRPHEIVAGPGLVLDLWQLLPSLRGVFLMARTLLSTILSNGFVEHPVYAHVQRLEIALLADNEGTEDLRGDEDACVLAICLAMPRIEALKISGNYATLPIEFLNLSPARVLIGGDCPNYVDYGYPKIADVRWHLPRLRTVQLCGNIVSPGTFLLLQDLPFLEHVALNEHTQLDKSSLLDLIRSVELEHLHINICACGDVLSPKKLGQHSAPRALGVPRWPRKLGYFDAQEVIAAARKKGVCVAGSIVCAVRCCGGVGGDQCGARRWYGDP